MKPLPLILAAVVAALSLPRSGAADAVLDWNEAALAHVAAAGQLPPNAARTMALVHVALFDALNAIALRYEPYALRGAAADTAAPEAAAAAAARGVLVALFPHQREAIDAAYAAALAGVPEGEPRRAGIALGERAAAACLAGRAADGAGAAESYRPATRPGVYVPTAIPVSSTWPRVAPWVLAGGAALRPAPPPALTSERWARDYNEVKATGGRESATRTAEQTETARFWIVTGPASWNPVVRSLVSGDAADLLDRARLFALVHLAAADALLAVFDAKYAYSFWRPITAIRNGDADGNDATEPEPGWLPLVDTPLHPEYPCAHCITAAAVGEVLAARYGRGEVRPIEMTSPTAPGVTHSWRRIADYVTEVSQARIWGGIHYRHSTEVGERMGREIAALARREWLRPLAPATSP